MGIAILMFAAGTIGFTLGHIKGFGEYEESEREAKTFWEEVERKGVK